MEKSQKEENHSFALFLKKMVRDDKAKQFKELKELLNDGTMSPEEIESFLKVVDTHINESLKITVRELDEIHPGFAEEMKKVD